MNASGILDPSPLLVGAGPWALVLLGAVILIETGLLFPFLPGDSLIFAAALVAPGLGLPLWSVMLTVAIAAVIGDSIGYALGARLGRRLFRRDARVFKLRYLERAEVFFARHGAPSLVLARFVPIVRTFVPPVVGAAGMPYRRFLLWNVVGAVAWSVLLSLAGALLGRIAFVADNVELIAIAIVALSLVPIVVTIVRERRADRASGTVGSDETATHPRA